MKAKTHKQILIDTLTDLKLRYEELYYDMSSSKDPEVKHKANIYFNKSMQLKGIRAKVKSLPGKHFVPHYHKTGEYLSVKLSCKSIGIILP
jgi:hypothetical protein